MNTRFCYLYRDACNYKRFSEVVIGGVLDQKQIDPLLKDRQFFVPSEVGLDDLQDEVFTVDDHIWHEVDRLEPTDDAPTAEISAAGLVARFAEASRNLWNEGEVFKRKGLL